MCANQIIRTLLFVVDTSIEMIDGGINAVNGAISGAIAKIRDFSQKHPDLNLLFKVSVLEFSDAGTVMSNPEDIATYEWKDLVAKGCEAKISDAFKLLNEKLSDDTIMGPYDGNSSLAVILITSSEPDDDYLVRLGDLRQNELFEQSTRRVINFNREPSNTLLNDFTSVNVRGEFEDSTLPPKYIANEIDVISASTVPSFRRKVLNTSFKIAPPDFVADIFFQELSYEDREGYTLDVWRNLER